MNIPKNYQDLIVRIKALLADEEDWVSAMATIVCELHHHFEDYHWTGFYRVTAPEVLKIGPYQGSHGCLVIPFHKGVCGKAARDKQTQIVTDVHKVADHIACSATTQSEIVVPILNGQGEVVAVLDVDSDKLAAFDHEDQMNLEELARYLGQKYFG